MSIKKCSSLKIVSKRGERVSPLWADVCTGEISALNSLTLYGMTVAYKNDPDNFAVLCGGTSGATGPDVLGIFCCELYGVSRTMASQF